MAGLVESVSVDRVAEAEALAVAARCECTSAQAAFDELSARLGRGESVTAAEYGEAEIAVRLATTRQGIANANAKQAAEQDRQARITGFGEYAAARLDRAGFDAALTGLHSAAAALFREASEYNGNLSELKTELRDSLSHVPGESHQYRFGARVNYNGFDATGQTFNQIDVEEAARETMRNAFREVFPYGQNSF